MNLDDTPTLITAIRKAIAAVHETPSAAELERDLAALKAENERLRWALKRIADIAALGKPK